MLQGLTDFAHPFHQREVFRDIYTISVLYFYGVFTVFVRYLYGVVPYLGTLFPYLGTLFPYLGTLFSVSRYLYGVSAVMIRGREVDISRFNVRKSTVACMGPHEPSRGCRPGGKHGYNICTIFVRYLRYIGTLFCVNPTDR